ncbi:wax ester/triacylglycerol synthase domain-containing protein [Aeromicrobium sp.]
MVEFMRNSDAFTVGMEHDAHLRSTVVSILLFDKSPDWSVVVDRFDRVVRLMPMFRQRVVPTMAPAPPRWVYDPDFDLRFHMRRITAPAPGDLDSIMEMARRAEMEEFDHARPMWKVTQVDGLADGGAALVVKMHHALADGIGAMQVAMIVFDLQEEPTDLGPLPPEPAAVEPGAFDGIRYSLQYDAALVRNLAKGAASAPSAVVGGVLRPLETVRSAVATAASVYRTVRPISDTASPIMKDRRLVRELWVHEVPKPLLMDAAHAMGGTLNDAFLAGVTGGLRLYHAEHGAKVGDLRVTMPVNIRAEGDQAGGNRITLMRLALPVGVADPAERIRQIHVRASAARNERSLPYTQAIAGGLNLVPRWYIGAILQHVDFLASNVPGIPVPVYLGRARLRMQYAFGPTIGAGVNVTLLTYVDTCSIGVNVDTGAIPDVDVFRKCLVAGFDEVLALATNAPSGTKPKRKTTRKVAAKGGRAKRPPKARAKVAGPTEPAQ